MPRGEKLKDVHAIARRIWRQGRETYTEAVRRAWDEMPKKPAKVVKKRKANAAS